MAGATIPKEYFNTQLFWVECLYDALPENFRRRREREMHGTSKVDSIIVYNDSTFTGPNHMRAWYKRAREIYIERMKEADIASQ